VISKFLLVINCDEISAKHFDWISFVSFCKPLCRAGKYFFLDKKVFKKSSQNNHYPPARLTRARYFG